MALETALPPVKPWKLVCRIEIDSKLSILDATITPDGQFVAVATRSEIKVFELRKKAHTDALRVRTMTMPGGMATTGARIIQFSPNGKWLAAASVFDEISVARVDDHAERGRHFVLSKVAHLDRPRRDDHSDSCIAKLAFASDSSVLVVGDRGGHLDSWVLEGREDSTAPAMDRIASTSRHGSRSGPGSESDSSSDSDDSDEVTLVYYGQHWTCNPHGALLPRLDSAPLVMTFRPTASETSESDRGHGNPGVHPTRHNPHAHSNALPTGEHKLWIMTVKHQMYELDALAGRLTDWSRRNPSRVPPSGLYKAS